MEHEESCCLTSDYTKKLQSSREYGTGTKTEYRLMEQDRKPRNEPMHLWEPYFRQRRQEYTMGQLFIAPFKTSQSKSGEKT